MKKIILAMVLVFALSSAAFAAGPVWGIGISNILLSPGADNLGPSQIALGTLFYNFNNQHSIEGNVGVFRGSAFTDPESNITLIGLKYLFNFYTSARFNSHIGIQGTTVSASGGTKMTLTDIGLLFGVENFINDHFSLLADLTAHSYALGADFPGFAGYNASAINVWPTLSFRFYM